MENPIGTPNIWIVVEISSNFFSWSYGPRVHLGMIISVMFKVSFHPIFSEFLTPSGNQMHIVSSFGYAGCQIGYIDSLTLISSILKFFNFLFFLNLNQNSSTILLFNTTQLINFGALVTSLIFALNFLNIYMNNSE